MPKRAPQQIFASRQDSSPGMAEALLDLVGRIPTPREPKHADPATHAQTIARRAAIKAAAAAGTLALPTGPLGWATIGPELYAVWKIQAQMVADIAGAYGKPELLSREQMLYSLFSHTAASAFRNLVVNVGERYLVRRAPLSALYAIGNKVALRIAQRSASRLVTRWVPALGALGVAGYVYIDTGHVADASIELFSADLHIEDEIGIDGGEIAASGKAGAKRAARPAASGPKRRAKAKPKERAAAGQKNQNKRVSAAPPVKDKQAGKAPRPPAGATRKASRSRPG